MSERVSYSLACSAPGCRFARVCLRSLAEAEELARQHAAGGHAVEVSVETIRVVGRYGQGRRRA